jgi:uncharacterized membrane protein YgdD (TMEM256/DUF423 family)
MNKTALVWGTIFGALSVVLGAFAAHGLKKIMEPEQIQTFETGVRYQMYHSFALLIAGILFASFPNKYLALSATLFVIGIFCFSGSLYALAYLKMIGQVGLGGVGIITPIGGLFFIAGWVMVLLGVLKKG